MRDERDKRSLARDVASLNGDNALRLHAQIHRLYLRLIEFEASVWESSHIILQWETCLCFVDRGVQVE